jgi:hypothetical protein
VLVRAQAQEGPVVDDVEGEVARGRSHSRGFPRSLVGRSRQGVR